MVGYGCKALVSLASCLDQLHYYLMVLMLLIFLCTISSSADMFEVCFADPYKACGFAGISVVVYELMWQVCIGWRDCICCRWILLGRLLID